jgi:hypothetical protein
MLKYNIENNIDFYNKLYNSLNNENDEIILNDNNDDNKCLISYEPLIDKFVELNCGHKFNYIPLYKDILNHKYKFNNMEGKFSRLNLNEIRCPYCRKIQNGVLPYYEELGLDKKNGVNYYEPIENKQKILLKKYNILKKCDYLIENENYNINDNNSIEIGDDSSMNCKFIKCNNFGSKSKSILINDDKYYCSNHKKLILINKKKEEKEKLKEEKQKLKEEKIKCKEYEKNLKLQMKIEENQIKLKLKNDEKKYKLLLANDCNNEIKKLKLFNKKEEEKIKKIYLSNNNNNELSIELNKLRELLKINIKNLREQYKEKFNIEKGKIKLDIKEEFYVIKNQNNNNYNNYFEEKKEELEELENIIVGPSKIN